MIVAPLMTPILGTVLSVVTGDKANLAVPLALVVAGAVAVVAIAWLLGQLVQIDVVADTNTQVAGRVHPRLIDLVAAIATGVVGSFAMVRSDVSDTLPGVAIAISLVPPLAVVGLTLEAGATGQASGALLLFVTNVVAILLSGLAVMAIYRVTATGASQVTSPGAMHRRAVVVVIASVIVRPPRSPSRPGGSPRRACNAPTPRRRPRRGRSRAGWRLLAVDVDRVGIRIRAAGRLPSPDPAELRTALDEQGLDGVDVVVVVLSPRSASSFPGAERARQVPGER